MGFLQPLRSSTTSSNGRVHETTTIDGITTSSKTLAYFPFLCVPSTLTNDDSSNGLQQQEQQMMYAQQQQQAMQAQYAQQQAYEEHLRQQQLMYAQQLQQSQQQQQQPIQPQPTGFGANNPFAAFASNGPQSQPSPQPQPQRQPSPPPPVPQIQQQQQAPPPTTQQVQPQRTGPRFRADGDGKHGELAKMLAGGREDGLDTFGNIGSSRVPVWQQKTGQQGGMVPQMTGLAKPNPFGASGYKPQQQFNQPTGYGQQNGQQQQQQQNVSRSPIMSCRFFDFRNES